MLDLDHELYHRYNRSFSQVTLTNVLKVLKIINFVVLAGTVDFSFWSHIASFYDYDANCDLHMLNKLTSDHINLTPFSVMRVR